MRRQLGRCAGPCGEVLPPTYQLDHRLPWCLTFDDGADNLDALCPNCHALKTRHEARALALIKRLRPSERLCPRCCRVVSRYLHHVCPVPASERPKLNVPAVVAALGGAAIPDAADRLACPPTCQLASFAWSPEPKHAVPFL